MSRAMSGMTGASMLRTRRRDVNLKPNRRLDRKSSRGMLYENEELRLRTININAEVERGQSDIKKLKRENDQLKREISALRYEYDRLDTLLRERRLSPEHSDDSASICSACPECVSIDSCARVAFNDLSVVPEEGEQDGNRSGVESPCSCKECQQDQLKQSKATQSQPTIRVTQPSPINAQEIQEPNTNYSSNNANINDVENNERVVDVLVHDAPVEPQFFESINSPPYTPPPPPGFVIIPQQPPKFRTGGNVEDLLGVIQASPSVQTTFIQQNSIFMCNTRRITQRRECCCQKRDPVPSISPITIQTETESPASKYYVTEKNIEVNYDYPRGTPVHTPTPKLNDDVTTTTEVASTVVFVERRIPVKPKKFDFFFRSRSAPVGENEEPIYATVNKLPKRLRRMELNNLEKEVSYNENIDKEKEPDSSRTETILKTDSESQIPQNDDTSQSEREKSVIPQRPDSPKAKKRKRFSLTFKKRERKRREKKETAKNTVKNGGPVMLESDNERLIDEHELKHRHCTRHRPRNTMSSSSSGPRYKRDSYHEMTTSHSEHERTNSVCSSVNSLGSACTHKSRNLSVLPQDGGSIPWCGCWGAGCV